MHAALTIVYNESVNLPIWIDYYGRLFGRGNLFVIDHQSTDGSTQNLGEVNVTRIPREKYDNSDKSHILSSMHSALLRAYDTVAVTDCDELLVPDPAKYQDLNDYIARALADYATGLGLDVKHIIDREAPIDLARPILAQRKYAVFSSSECKTLLSRIPLTLAPGAHALTVPPKFDPDLFVFHLKLMDYGLAFTRQQTINLQLPWSERSFTNQEGVHHRYPISDFIRQSFVSPLNTQDVFSDTEFSFARELAGLNSSVKLAANGRYEYSFETWRHVTIPERFAAVF
jgi:hypothetical protein